MTAYDAEPITIDELTLADAERCAQLEAQLFPGDDPWPVAAFARELAATNSHYVAARTADTLVGYGGIARLGRRPPFEYEVHTIGVDPAYHGRGIGRRLLNELLRFAAGEPSTSKCAPTMPPRSPCTAARDSSTSACAGAITG